MTFAEFRYRYAILAADEAAEPDAGPASKKMLDKLSKANKLQVENFKVGKTKVFFKAGILAKLEDYRDAALTIVITKLQSTCRAYLARCQYQRLQRQTYAVIQVQKNIRAWITLRTWLWYKLYQRVKPLLVGLRSNAEVEALEKKIKVNQTFFSLHYFLPFFLLFVYVLDWFQLCSQKCWDMLEP